ncbi:MAG: aspartate aminotransferase family protein [Cyclonatronaceae bacterium]
MLPSGPTKDKRSSEDIYKQACDVITGGVSRNTVFRRPHPFYASHASGCYVTDIDGVEHIDFANNMASLIHGHTHPAIVSAVVEQLMRGSAYTMATEAEVTFAQLLHDRVPSFERIRFVNSGTEAMMALIKVARAFTGRPMIAKAEGSYHGTYDFAEVSQAANPENWGDLDEPNRIPLVNGTPQGVMDNVVIFPYNDTERTLALLDKYADQIACVIIDPVAHRIGLFEADQSYVDALYAWTRRNGALLAFDEVVTLRVNYGGTQENYQVKPDLTSIGKIIGGGFPVGGLAGRSDIMKVLDPREQRVLFPHSGPFSANPVTMTAGRLAMELFDREAVKTLNALTDIARFQILEAGREAGIPLSLTGAGSMFRIHFREAAPNRYREAYQPKEEVAILKEFLDYMHVQQHIMMINTGTCMLSTAITRSEVDRLTEAMLNGFRYIKPGLDALHAKEPKTA